MKYEIINMQKGERCFPFFVAERQYFFGKTPENESMLHNR